MAAQVLIYNQVYRTISEQRGTCPPSPWCFTWLVWHHKGMSWASVLKTLAVLRAQILQAGELAPGSATKPVMASQFCLMGFWVWSSSALS